MSSVEQKSKPEQQKWIWPFELLEQIGEGGMGVVYRARYVVNGREVALKMIPQDVTDETTLARFERELEVLKTLKHPNIVRCFGGSCDNNRRFYAMELIDGGTLEDKLEQREKLPWEQVIYYGLQICDALACSHDKGVVHRDLKPANFLIDKTGLLKLSDFGLASVAAARKITAEGKTAGTFLYMAPEQIYGHKVSPRTDLYALGCVLYEMLTGEPPFIGETAAATLHKHCRDTPRRPSEIALDCPMDLEKLVLQLLEKKEDDRPQSAAEVAKKLKGVKRNVTVVSQDRLTQLEQATRKPLLPKTLQQSESREQRRIHFISANRTVTILTILLVSSLCWNLAQLFSSNVSSPAEKLWVQAVESNSMPVKLAAIESIGEITSKSGRHLGLLKETLENGDPVIREAGVNAIKTAGAPAKELTPVLLALVKLDPDASVRESAKTAVTHLQSLNDKPDRSWIGTAMLLLLMTSGAIVFYKWILHRQSPELSARN